ncbi:MAG: protein kinase domain-containing protein [Planctomycetota bacterium]
MSDVPDDPAPDVASLSPADLTGRQLGDFRVLRRLGRGAMAEVYLAEQGQLKRLVALKVLKADLASDQTYLRRFEREAQAAASLVHANIVQIYEVGQSGGLRYIAQEYVQGANLREWVVRQGPLDLAHALSVMRQVTSALVKAGEQGVVHRDIKPENIMLTVEGEVKVADFGLARLSHGPEDSELTQVGITMGTPLYMSPEQVEGKPLDPRSDIYSFGVTCYHMLSGHPPFTGETALGVAVQHLKNEPTRLEKLRPDLPPALCSLVHKMLAKSTEQRFASARELLAELRRIQTEYGGQAWTEELPSWDATVALPAKRRTELTQQLGGLMHTLAVARPKPPNRWLAFSAIAAAALVGGLLAWWLMADRPLLAGAGDESGSVPKQDTAMQQWFFATRAAKSPRAWRGVIEHYGREYPDLALRAEQQLAQLYLERNEFGKALELFQKFASPAETDESLRALGLAGEYVVFRQQGKVDQAAAALEKLFPLRDKLRDTNMQRLMDELLSEDK